MFTEPEIITTDDLSVRSYVKFYYNNVRYREYSGKRLGKPIYPNRAKTLTERNKALRKLRLEILTALENDGFLEPVIVKTPIKPIKNEPTTDELLKQAINKKQATNLTPKYKESLKTTYDQFIKFLSVDELNSPIDDITPARIEEFLMIFNCSNTYYMSKRTELNVLFNVVSKLLNRQLYSAKGTERRRLKANLHIPFEQTRLKQLLAYLKVNHFNLYLGCLITYGTFLRPHKEVRLLTIGHFRKDFTEIHLSGTENKSGKVRVVFVADYIRDEIVSKFSGLPEDTNIFSLHRIPHNQYYFNTAWTRVWADATIKLKKNETIYSFRHSAAVHVYRKTKDLHLLQQLLGHSDMIVTLKYLRGLGEMDIEHLKHAMPEL